MRWFKHLSDTYDDENMQCYLAECKNQMEGYGFYFRITEIVAKHMEKGKPDHCEVTYPLKQWARLCNMHHNSVITLLEKLGSNSLVTLQQDESKYTVKIPKLLNLLDEYTNKIRRSSGESQEQETETEKKKEGETESKNVLQEELTHYDFILKNDLFYVLPVSLYNQLAKTFPTVNLDTELIKAQTWLISNKPKRKTATGMPRFLNSWLTTAKPIPSDGIGMFPVEEFAS